MHSCFTFVVWRNDDHDVPAEEVIAFDRAIGAEDRRMLERVPGVLPLDVDGDGQRAGRPGQRRVAPPAGGAAGGVIIRVPEAGYALTPYSGGASTRVDLDEGAAGPELAGVVAVGRGRDAGQLEHLDRAGEAGQLDGAVRVSP